MKRVRVIISYAGLSIPHLIELSRTIVAKMATNEALFANPDVAYAAVVSAINTLEIKYNATRGGSKQQTVEMHQAHEVLLGMLRTLALYVDRIAHGNEAIILSTGFDTTKQPKPIERGDFSVENTDNEGEIILKRKSFKGAAAWVWQQCIDPLNEQKWEQIAITTQGTLTLNKLPLCTRYWFRSAAITKDGQTDWSEQLSIIVT